jgi:hypothetical protein
VAAWPSRARRGRAWHLQGAELPRAERRRPQAGEGDLRVGSGDARVRSGRRGSNPRPLAWEAKKGAPTGDHDRRQRATGATNHAGLRVRSLSKTRFAALAPFAAFWPGGGHGGFALLRGLDLEQSDERRLVLLVERNDVEDAEASAVDPALPFSNRYPTYRRSANPLEILS